MQRMGARVVEGSGLLSRRALRRPVGSNPTLSSFSCPLFLRVV